MKPIDPSPPDPDLEVLSIDFVPHPSCPVFYTLISNFPAREMILTCQDPVFDYSLVVLSWAVRRLCPVDSISDAQRMLCLIILLLVKGEKRLFLLIFWCWFAAFLQVHFGLKDI